MKVLLLFAVLTVVAVSVDSSSVSEPCSDCATDESTCEPGKSFKLSCNTCICGSDGLRKSAACTQMGCAVGVLYVNGTSKTPEESLSNKLLRNTRQTDAICKPGASRNDGHTYCWCNNDGKGWHCASAGARNVVVELLTFVCVTASICLAAIW